MIFYYFVSGKRHSDSVCEQTTRGNNDSGDRLSDHHVLLALRPKLVGLDHYLHAQQRATANELRLPTPSLVSQPPDRRARGSTAATRVRHVRR